ncbi:MAG TPA: hypothetical protein PKI20_20255 [Verrucomicrobiota bacterium]|nr:hypothetical protein [Verrucomicrobiota bacterium]HQL80134.1 hypothetical protein [Verrucomicrobiota bacterium]
MPIGAWLGGGRAQGKLIPLPPPGLAVSTPPSQAKAQALADKLDGLVNILNA